MKLYVRNIKKGFATNSSSYHSTLIHYIDIPKEIWVEFQSNDVDITDDDSDKGYIRSSGLVLLDDEDYMWRSISELSQFSYEVETRADGMVRIKVETTEDDRYNLKSRY